MLERIGDFLCLKALRKSEPLVPDSFLNGASLRKNFSGHKQVFSKVFRWQLPERVDGEPASVEVVGSFTHWQKVPLERNGVPNTWQVMLSDIPNNRTHRYMMLVNGQPIYDKYNDGLALPQGPEEEQYQIMTDKGPRVFILFSQTK